VCLIITPEPAKPSAFLEANVFLLLPHSTICAQDPTDARTEILDTLAA
jgi:hypothetical protein